MERIQAEINWDYLEMNLTQELYQKIEDKLGNSGTIMTPYNLEILERWVREFPQIKTAKFIIHRMNTIWTVISI